MLGLVFGLGSLQWTWTQTFELRLYFNWALFLGLRLTFGLDFLSSGSKSNNGPKLTTWSRAHIFGYFGNYGVIQSSEHFFVVLGLGLRCTAFAKSFALALDGFDLCPQTKQ